MGLVGKEKYGYDRSTDGMGTGREAGKYAGEVRRALRLFSRHENQNKSREPLTSVSHLVATIFNYHYLLSIL